MTVLRKVAAMAAVVVVIIAVLNFSFAHKHPAETWTSLTNMPKSIAQFAIDTPSRSDTKVMMLHA